MRKTVPELVKGTRAAPFLWRRVLFVVLAVVGLITTLRLHEVAPRRSLLGLRRLRRRRPALLALPHGRDGIRGLGLLRLVPLLVDRLGHVRKARRVRFRKTRLVLGLGRRVVLRVFQS